jgi:hypothetical protein
MDPISFRALERILAVAIGGIAIYLGYRLFLKLPDKTDSQGKFILPGNISIYISRVGPGVFFALFGASILALSFYKGITYEAESDAKNSSQGKDSTVVAQIVEKQFYGGITGQASVSKEDLEIRRAGLRRRILLLNRLPDMLNKDLPPGKRSDVVNGLPHIKLSLIKTVWGPDWGDPAALDKWVEEGAIGAPPAGLEEAARMFSYGSLSDR